MFVYFAFFGLFFLPFCSDFSLLSFAAKTPPFLCRNVSVCVLFAAAAAAALLRSHTSHFFRCSWCTALSVYRYAGARATLGRHLRGAGGDGRRPERR